MPSNFRAMIQTVRGAHADMLDNRHFLLTLMAALLLHVLGLYLYNLLPKPQVIDIPVRALNIKLGDGDELSPEELKMASPGGGNKTDVENTISRLVRDQSPETMARESSMTSSVDKAVSQLNKAMLPSSAPKAKVVGRLDVRSEGIASAAPVMAVSERQFVRDLPAPPKSEAADGNAGGNSSAKDAEMIARYEQQLSVWIEKFKIYPSEARAKNMQGETVVRLRIDRRGNVRYYALERTTGSQELDRAAMDMIRRANPVPAAPLEYPRGDLLEFLIPVSFHLQ